MEELDASNIELTNINIDTNETVSYSTIDIENDNNKLRDNIKSILWICGSILYIILPSVVIGFEIYCYYHYDSCSSDVMIITIIYDSFAIIIWAYLLYEHFILKSIHHSYRAYIFGLNASRFAIIIMVFLLNNESTGVQFYFTTITAILDMIGVIIIVIFIMEIL